MIRQSDCFLIPRLEGLCPLVHWLSRWFVAFAVITSDSESSTAQTHCQLESWRVHKMHEHLTGEVFRINQRLVVCFVFCFFIFPPVLNGVFSELHDCSYKSVLIIFLNECSLHAWDWKHLAVFMWSLFYSWVRDVVCFVKDPTIWETTKFF